MGTHQRERKVTVRDEFDARWLAPDWQWPTDRPRLQTRRTGGGRLVLGTSRQRGEPPPGVAGRRRLGRFLPGIVGRQPGGANYRAEAGIGASRGGARPGLAVYTAAESALGLELRGRTVVLWRAQGNRTAVVAALPAPNPQPTLRITGHDDGTFTFQVATPRGWATLGPARYRLPWLLTVPRVVLRVAGPRGARAAFERFTISSSP
jgi:hypothetical protein